MTDTNTNTNPRIPQERQFRTHDLIVHIHLNQLDA